MFNHNLVSFRALCGLRARKTGSADISGLGLVLCGWDDADLDRVVFRRSGVVDFFADSALVACFQLSAESDSIFFDEFRSVPSFAGADDFVGLGLLDTSCLPIAEPVAMSDDNETDDLRLALCGPINVHFTTFTPGMVGDGFPLGSFPSMQAAARAVAYDVSSYDFPAGRGEYRVAGGGVIGYRWRSEGLHIFHATRDDISGREFFRSDDLALFGAANFAERGWFQADDFAWLCGSGVLDTVCSSAGFMWRCDSGSEPWRGDYMPIASRCGCLPLVSLPDDISGALLARSV